MVKVGEIYETARNGKLEVISYRNAKDVTVKFIETGTVTKTRAELIKSGVVKDNFKPHICGVGYFGDGPFKAKIKGKETRAYSVWHAIIWRCYHESSAKMHPTYKDVTVCEEWHNFQNFAKWYSENSKELAGEFEIDKDIKSKGRKIYSPSTCCLVTRQENIDASLPKEYLFKNPDGDTVKIRNLDKFCRENGLSKSNMCNVNKGKRRVHKGWTKA